MACRKWTFILVATILVGSVGCTSDFHLRRAIKKDPSLLAAGKTEIVYDTVRVITEGARVDTIVALHEVFRDTIHLHTAEVRAKVFVDTVLQTLYLEAECPPDTVFVPVETQVTKYEFEVKKGFWQTIREIPSIAWLIALVAGILGGLYLLIRRPR